jgi:hypothetical protein
MSFQAYLDNIEAKTGKVPQELGGKNKMNKEWHAKNRMPKNPTLEQRMDWHIRHAQNCNCRKMPEKLRAEMKKYKSKNS